MNLTDITERKEKFFARCIHPVTKEVYVHEAVGDYSFKVRGQRFIVTGDRVTCALSGAAVYLSDHGQVGQFLEDFQEITKQRIEKNWDQYIKQLKERPRVNWGARKIPVIEGKEVRITGGETE